MERLILAPPKEIFSRKRDVLKGRPKLPTEFPNGKYAFHLLVSSSSRPFGPGLPLILSSEISPCKFPFRI